MNAKITRTLALVLALVLCLGMLAGCGPKDDPTTTPSTSSTPSSEAKPLKNVDIYPLKSDKTFTVFGGGTDFDGRDAVKMWEKVTGVKIDWVGWDKPTMNNALATDSFTDAGMHTTRLTKAQMYEYGKEGKFIDFMKYLNIMPNVKAMFEKYPESLEIVQNEDGTVYSLPQVKYNSGASASYALVFRGDMLKAAGWDKAPATTDEFLECIIDIQNHFGKDDAEFRAFDAYRANYMAWNSDTGSSNMMHAFFPSFGKLDSTALSVGSDGKVVFGAYTDQYKQTLKYLNQLWNSGAMSQDVYTEDGTVSQALIAQNKIASGLNMVNLTAKQFEGEKIDVVVCEPLTSPYNSEKNTYMSEGAGVTFAWQCNMINAKCSDIETLCKWMDSFYAVEENPLNEEGTIWGLSFGYGELNKDWKRDEKANTYEILPHEGYDSGAVWRSKNCISTAPNFYFPYQMGDGSWASLKSLEIQKNITPYVVEGFNISKLSLTEDESDEYAMIWTGIDTYLTEMTAQFITGRKNIDSEWKDFQKQLKVLGVEDLIDIYQTAYNRYIQSKK